MAIEYAVRATAFILYDGTNSSEVLDAALAASHPSAEIVSDEDGVLTINVDPFLGNSVLEAGARLNPSDGEVISAAIWSEQFIVKE